MQRNIKLLG